MADWSLASLQLKLIKIGARVVRHARAIIFQLAEASASWNMMARAWRTTRAPILISFNCRLANDQSAIALGGVVTLSRAFVKLWYRWYLKRHSLRISTPRLLRADGSEW